MPEWLRMMLSPIAALFRRAVQPSDVLIIDRYRDELDRQDKQHSVEILRLSQRLDACEERHRSRDIETVALRHEINSLRDNILQFQKDRLKGLITINTSSIIVEANEDMAIICEMALDKLIGSPLYKIVPHRYRNTHDERFQSVRRGDTELRKPPLDTFILTAGGHEAPITIKSLSKWGHEESSQFTAEVVRR